MKYLFKSGTLAGDEKFTGRGEFTSYGNFVRRETFTGDEDAQLDAWDRSNAPLEVEDAFKDHLLDVYNAAEQTEKTSRLFDAGDDAKSALRAFAATDQMLCLMMEQDAAAESKRETDEFYNSAKLHEAFLHRVALRLSGNKAIAEDLVQETVTRALSRVGQFKSGTHVRAWMTTTLTRLFYDQLKHEKVVARAEPELATLETTGGDAELPNIPDATLWAAVQSLDVTLRDVVDRCYVKDMRYKAAAEELKLPVGTVGTRLRRARECLKTLLTADAVKP